MKLLIPFYIQEFNHSTNKNKFEANQLPLFLNLSIENKWTNCIESIVNDFTMSYPLPSLLFSVILFFHIHDKVSLFSPPCIDLIFLINDIETLESYFSLNLVVTDYFYSVYQTASLFSKEITQSMFKGSMDLTLYFQHMLRFPLVETLSTWASLVSRLEPQLILFVFSKYVSENFQDPKDFVI